MHQEEGEVLIGAVVIWQLINIVVFATSTKHDRIVVERFWVGRIHLGGDRQLVGVVSSVCMSSISHSVSDLLIIQAAGNVGEICKEEIRPSPFWCVKELVMSPRMSLGVIPSGSVTSGNSFSRGFDRPSHSHGGNGVGSLYLLVENS